MWSAIKSFFVSLWNKISPSVESAVQADVVKVVSQAEVKVQNASLDNVTKLK